MILEEEVEEFFKEFESLVTSAHLRVKECQWYVANKPSEENNGYLAGAKKQLEILEDALSDLEDDWDGDSNNIWRLNKSHENN